MAFFERIQILVLIFAKLIFFYYWIQQICDLQSFVSEKFYNMIWSQEQIHHTRVINNPMKWKWPINKRKKNTFLYPSLNWDSHFLGSISKYLSKTLTCICSFPVRFRVNLSMTVWWKRDKVWTGLGSATPNYENCVFQNMTV